MSSSNPTSSPPMSPADRLRMFGVRTLGSWPAFRIEYRLSWLWGLATSRWRSVQPPIFVWGPGRTGSYLLYDVLSMHPALVCPRSVLRDNKGLYGTQHYGGGEYDHLLSNPFPPIEGYKRMIGRPHPHIESTGQWSPDDVRQIRRRFERMAAGGLTSKRILDKAPWYTFVTELLDDLFPGVQHICCLRNPFATAVSYYRRMCEPDALTHGFWGWRPQGWEAYADRPLEDRATWLAIDAVRQSLANVKRIGERALIVKYEDLVAQPHEEMERVSQFLKLSSWQGRLDGIPPSFPNYNRPARAPTNDAALVDELRRLCDELDYAAE